jgi:hypothetical protein
MAGTLLTEMYCLAKYPDPKQQEYINLGKVGDRPSVQLLRSLSPRSLQRPVPNRACHSVPGYICHSDGRTSDGSPLSDGAKVAAGKDLDDKKRT